MVGWTMLFEQNYVSELYISEQSECMNVWSLNVYWGQYAVKVRRHTQW